MHNRSLFIDTEKETNAGLSKEIGDSLSLTVPVNLVACGNLDSYFAVSELASLSIGAVGSAISSFIKSAGLSQAAPLVRVDHRLASLWFNHSIYPKDWELPPAWDSIAGDYQTSDGWIKLHTNLAHHRDSVLKVLDVARDREQVSAAITRWASDDLESAIVSAGGVAAAMRSRHEWVHHSQGIAIASEPLITWGEPYEGNVDFSPVSQQRPLKGLRVLDLTRVLAGPVATRTLAGFGADVLRIDPPNWDEPFVVPDITLGKRCSYLDLNKRQDRETFEVLLKQADVLVHGYRPGALDDLGYDQVARQKLSSNLIEISLNAYGWTGPWASRRGFDSLVQMSCGIADTGLHWKGVNKPTPLPVQALDHATGYLMAAAVIRLIQEALNENRIGNARLSLTRTSELLQSYPQNESTVFNSIASNNDFSKEVELTPWGLANRLKPAISIVGTEMKWDKPASTLGSGAACWL